MYISPDSFNSIKQECLAAIKRAEKYLNGKTTDGKVIPMHCADEAIAVSKELSSVKGKVEMAIRSLKNSKKKKLYIERENELIRLGKEIEKLYRSLMPPLY